MACRTCTVGCTVGCTIGCTVGCTDAAAACGDKCRNTAAQSESSRSHRNLSTIAAPDQRDAINTTI
jgi:hypothetical protein